MSDIKCQNCHEPWDIHHVHGYFDEFTTHELSDPELPIVTQCPCCEPKSTILRDRVMTAEAKSTYQQLELNL